MSLFKYIFLSPVGDHKEEYLDAFLASIKGLDPPPEEIVWCVDVDTVLPLERYEGVKFVRSSAIDYNRGTLARIGPAREVLRNYFIHKRSDLHYALWVDSDMEFPPELAVTLYDVMEEEERIVVVNKYPGRSGEDSRWCGSGCMLTHRIACTVSLFHVGVIDVGIDKPKNLSEDYMFFSMVDQGSGAMRLWVNRSGRVCKEYLEITHHLGKRRHGRRPAPNAEKPERPSSNRG